MIDFRICRDVGYRLLRHARRHVGAVHNVGRPLQNHDISTLLEANVDRPARLEKMRRFVIATRLTALAADGSFDAVVEHFSAAQGQLLQDIFALVATGWMQGGTFVEVGVGDGRNLSNTYLLEKAFGWNGVLVDPNPRFHDSICSQRSARLDKRAAFNVSGRTVSFMLNESVGELSTIGEFAGRDGRERAGNLIEVETATLNDILACADLAKVDFLSVDTEGSEFEVLEGADLEKFKVSVLTVEHNHDAARLRRVDQMLQSRGYCRILGGQTFFDAWYVSKDVLDRLVADGARAIV